MVKNEKKKLPYTDYYTLMRLAYIYIYIYFFFYHNFVLVWSPKINSKFEKYIVYINYSINNRQLQDYVAAL